MIRHPRREMRKIVKCHSGRGRQSLGSRRILICCHNKILRLASLAQDDTVSLPLTRMILFYTSCEKVSPSSHRDTAVLHCLQESFSVSHRDAAVFIACVKSLLHFLKIRINHIIVRIAAGLAAEILGIKALAAAEILRAGLALGLLVHLGKQVLGILQQVFLAAL